MKIIIEKIIGFREKEEIQRVCFCECLQFYFFLYEKRRLANDTSGYHICCNNTICTFLADVLYDKYVGHSYFSPVRYIIKYIIYYILILWMENSRINGIIEIISMEVQL